MNRMAKYILICLALLGIYWLYRLHQHKKEYQLVRAVHANDVETVEKLLKDNININAQKGFKFLTTALHTAIEQGNVTR